MTGTSARTFVDTNILIYAYDVDAGAKHASAKALLKKLWLARDGMVSTQVLQEFYVNATRKIRTPLPKPVVRAVIADYTPWCVAGVTPADIMSACALEDSARLSFWDALIVAVATRSGALRIVSEDLNAGQSIAGVTIENPFRPS